VKLLVLGGTKFLGRAAVEAAIGRGHDVTLFNRGETNPELFPEAEKLHGDRAHDLSALEGRTWDAVIDPSGYVPHVVRASAEALAGSVGHYLFVSSISVYDDFSEPNDEESPLEELAEDKPVDRLLEDYSNYGALKVLCERAVAEAIPDRHALVRPGLIVGPHDPTGRFTYWPHRIARGGRVLVPGPPERTVQFVDVRDLASWLIDLSERKAGGPFNAVNEGVSWQTLVETCRDVAGSEARFTYVDGDYLVERGVGEWMELPLWLQDPEAAGMHATDVSRAIDAGLAFRPLTDTIRGALDEAETTDAAGMAPEREVEILGAWKAR
jgi:2'-hydroxyisoflavone reductase